jgi:acyl-CoA synthetase (AMP-forming)/AMP-acid ligase II
MNIAHILQQRARSDGSVVAIEDDTCVLTFAELDRVVAVLTRQLLAAGISVGTRVVVFCPMSATLYAVLSAVWRAGAVAVFVDPSAGARHVASCCARVQPQAFIGVPRAHLLRLMSRSLRYIPALSIDGRAPFAGLLRTTGVDGADQVTAVPPDAPALITFSSGSTGVPKAIVRSHGFLRAQHRVLSRELELGSGQRDLATLPMFVLANLASGVTSVIARGDLRHPGRIEADAIARQILATRPNRLAASPAFVARLCGHRRARHLLSRFERIHMGGAPVFPALLRSVAAAAPCADVVAVYGSSEAEPIARLRWSEATRADQDAMRRGAGLLVGDVAGATELRILPDRWAAIDACPSDVFEIAALPSGTAGEIVVSGDHVSAGYLDGASGDDAKVRVGERVWHRTGDAGYLDDRGRLWLLGRCAAIVRDSRGTLYPFAVECAAHDIAGVERAALVAEGGERVLLLELSAGSPTRVVAAVRGALTWAQLDRIERVRRLPTDGRHNAKIDYGALRRRRRLTSLSASTPA